MNHPSQAPLASAARHHQAHVPGTIRPKTLRRQLELLKTRRGGRPAKQRGLTCSIWP